MKYDDFPILNNSEYSLLAEQYTATNIKNRESVIKEICQELSICLSNCWLIENLYNNKIHLAITQTNKTLSKYLTNLSCLFEIQSQQTQTISTFNIFSFIKKINHIIRLTADWFSNEQKEYFKVVAKKSIDELLTSLDIIFSILEESNIHFYKHM